MLAARAICAGLKSGDACAAALAQYDRLVNASFIMQDLYRTRNMRLAFRHGFYGGGVRAAVMTLTGGRFPGGESAVDAYAAVTRRPAAPTPFVPHGKVTFSKLGSGFRTRNSPRETIHLHPV